MVGNLDNDPGRTTDFVTGSRLTVLDVGELRDLDSLGMR